MILPLEGGREGEREEREEGGREGGGREGRNILHNKETFWTSRFVLCREVVLFQR